MNFLNPWVALGLASVVIPALVILYFLKLRRREQLVPSTFLWKRAVQDLQVNAPFQRLRKNLLLLLQLLILAAALFALARPIVKSDVVSEKSVVLMIDRSGSMNTREGKQTRFEMAKEQAVRLVKTLNRTGGDWLSFFGFGGADAKTRVMVISFADRANVVAPFTTNTSDLVGLIEGLEPTDARTNLKEALDLAQAYMMPTRGGVEQTPISPETESRLILFSDGAFAELPDAAVHASGVTLMKAGEARDNVGITAIRVQRNYERPEILNVFLHVENFGPEPVTTDVTLYVDGRFSQGRVETVSLAGARPRQHAPPTEAAEPGEPVAPPPPAAAADDSGPRGSSGSMSFEFPLPQAAMLEARLSRDDALPIDNAVKALVPPPRKMKVLLVSAGNLFLDNVLRNLPLESFTYLTPEQYENAAADEIEINQRSIYDAVVFDKHDTDRLPSGNYLFVGCVPKAPGVQVEGPVDGFALMWWDETHAILRHVALDYVFASKGIRYSVPREAQTLIEGPHGPVLSRYASEGRHFLILGFAVEASTWALKPSFPVFMYNALRYLGAGDSGGESEPVRPGDALRITLPAEVNKATITRPDNKEVTVLADASHMARYAGTNLVGIYQVKPGLEGRDRFTVNLEDPAESDITPRETPRLGGKDVELGQTIRTATPEVWRWFVGAALVIALLEWYIYNRRVMI